MLRRFERGWMSALEKEALEIQQSVMIQHMGLPVRSFPAEIEGDNADGVVTLEEVSTASVSICGQACMHALAWQPHTALLYSINGLQRDELFDSDSCGYWLVPKR
jgi:hypothetical protein